MSWRTLLLGFAAGAVIATIIAVLWNEGSRDPDLQLIDTAATDALSRESGPEETNRYSPGGSNSSEDAAFVPHPPHEAENNEPRLPSVPDNPSLSNLVWTEQLAEALLTQLGGNGAYEGLLQRTFGDVPTNPVAALARLDDSQLANLLRGDADTLGRYIGAKFSAEEWMLWFEEAGMSGGLRGQVGAIVLHKAVDAQAGGVRDRAEHAQRVLALIDSQLEAWQGQPVNHAAKYALMKSFHEVCPVTGGRELIVRWTVDTPHGDEVIETMLAEALMFWRIADSLDTALKVLDTRRAGAIKGIIRAWSGIKIRTDRVAWRETEVRSLLALPISEAVRETEYPSAMTAASVWAASDLLSEFLEQIAQALMARRDSATCSAYGFEFLSIEDKQAAEAAWTDWFYSSDTYKTTAACWAATRAGMKEIAGTTRALDRMKSLALIDTNPISLRRAAAYALSWLDKTDRALAVLEAWLKHSAIDGELLEALGRIVLRSPKAQIEAVLAEMISDPTRIPADRHYPLFLLAIVESTKALDICEQHPSLLDADSVLLAAATAEAVLPETSTRAAALRSRISQPEPQWMSEIRLRLAGPDKRAEHRVVSYAWATGGG
ncbi:MAG: hypothetical protein K8I27_12460 [Planctomycetes bacterium]|nr:hypothetical protein [Planctomycetota bacterium]